MSATYEASGPPNVTEVRRVAAGLGAGRHVAVKVTSGQTFRGHIQAVHEEHLVLLRDRATIPIDIAYDEVQALGPNLSTGAKTAIWIVLGVAAVMVILAVAISCPDDALGFSV